MMTAQEMAGTNAPAEVPEGLGVHSFAGIRGGFFLQFFASIRKNALQKIRNPIQLFLEVVLPILFIVGLVGVWTATGRDNYPTTQFFKYNVSAMANVSSTLRAALCYNASATTIPIPGLGPCNMMRPLLKCYPKAVYGIPMDGFCSYVNPSLVDSLILSITNSQPVTVPRFDDLVLLQWLAMVASARGAFPFSANRAIRCGGYLNFVDFPPYTDMFVSYLNSTSKLFNAVYGGKFPTETLALSATETASVLGLAWGTVVFNNVSLDGFHYTLRLNRTGLPSTAMPPVNRFYVGGYGNAAQPLLYASGFNTLQELLNRWYTTTVQGLSDVPVPVQVPMGYVSFTDQQFLAFAGQLAPLIIVLSFLYPVSQLTKLIVIEKELRVREAMMIMGLGTGSFYASWVVAYALIYLVPCIIVTIVLNKTFLSQGDPVIIFFTYYLFALSCITLAGLMSAFFSKSRIAALIAPILFFAFAMPLFALDSVSVGVRGFLQLFSPSSFATGIQLIVTHEQSTGLGPKQLAYFRDDIPMIVVLIMLGMDTVIYFLLMLYADAVMPTEWGTPKHPLFIFIEPWKFLRRMCVSATGGKSEYDNDCDGRDLTGVYEPDPENATVSVHVKGLRKTFQRADGTSNLALNDFHWKLHEGQISVLLGHNGAGKTTAISLMTGMLDPDVGDCYVYGTSVRRDLHTVRREIGFCPQHNILWPDLTCAEHLRFFAALKGITGEAAEKSIDTFLKAVELFPKKDQYANALSGGEKRKLSVAIAFVGRSRLVFLDEPTAGMDVGARRHTWNLIKLMSKDRTIILTTHFMDEADLLGHSVAILSHGCLKCQGSPMFLKSRLGVGYSITTSIAPNSDADQVERTIISHVSDAQVVSKGAGELAMCLPIGAVSQFPNLLRDLEERGEALGVTSFGLTVTTLEEIFLTVAHGESVAFSKRRTSMSKIPPLAPLPQDVSPQAPAFSPSAGLSVSALGGTDVAPFEEIDIWNVTKEADGPKLWLQQLESLLVKRFHNGRRDNRTLCLQLVSPVIVILLAMLLNLINFDASIPYTMSPELYGTSVDVVAANCSNYFNLSRPLASNVITDARDSSELVDALSLSNHLVSTYKRHGNERYGAIYCNDYRARVLYNNSAFDVAVLFVNTSSYWEAAVLPNLYYENLIRKAKSLPTFKIRAVVHPLPLTAKESALFNSITKIIIGIIIMVPFTFIPSTFVSFVVKERECKARHLQNVSGARYYIYWLSNLLFDIVSFFLTEFLVVIVFLIFQRTEYVGDGPTFLALFLLFFFYGLSGCVSSYSFSFFFEEHSTAQNVTMLSNFIAGFLLVLVVYILSVIPSTKSQGEILRYVFRIIPSYCLGEGIINLAGLSLGFGGAPLDLNVTGWPIIYMAVEFPVFALLTLFIDHPGRRMKSQQMFHNPDAPLEAILNEDADVAEERRLIEENDPSRRDDLVIVRHLHKQYPTGKVAVKNLSFGVHSGEVFGFLGTNGAGKTTTISILCQEILPTVGRGIIAGNDIVDQAADALRFIGYCPQFDALLDLLTVREHLNLFAGIRGITLDVRERVVETLLSICELREYQQIVAMGLSGGNRRKLSVALALIGGPKVVFLDEPSAGMDPVARRGLWKAIKKISAGCSVVLTTHHLEEVEALAHRVAIMVDGTLRCIGNKTHLKHKYGSGFELSIRVERESHCNGVRQFIAEHIPDANLEEYRAHKFVYSLACNTRLSQTFALIEANKTALHITDYSVSQTSLEQVFLRISEANEDPEQPKSPMVTMSPQPA